jgi:hypothetical protein
MGKFEKFTNNPKEYRSPNDSFIARGVHINKLLKYIVEYGGLSGAVENLLLRDGQSTNVIVGNAKTIRSIHVTYLLRRGSAFQEGVVRILYDGTSVSVLDDFQDNGTSPQVIFTSSVSGLDIILTVTLASTGENGRLDAQIKTLGI